MTDPTASCRMEGAIRAYIRACNDADAKGIAACFHPEAVHYFQNASKWSSAPIIADHFSKRVREQGIVWTVDQILADADRGAAILEWTLFNKQGRRVRGVDWFVFEPETFRFLEVRCYMALSNQPELPMQELLDFDYKGRGYPMTRPA
jgi:methyltransferase